MSAVTGQFEAIEERAQKATDARKRYNVLEIRQPEILSALHKSQKDVPALLDLARKQQAALDAVRSMHVEEGNGNCIVCWDFNADTDVRFPCPTIKALADDA